MIRVLLPLLAVCTAVGVPHEPSVAGQVLLQQGAAVPCWQHTRRTRADRIVPNMSRWAGQTLQLRGGTAADARTAPAGKRGFFNWVFGKRASRTRTETVGEDEDVGSKDQTLQAMHLGQMMNDEQSFQHIERWKRSGQPGGAGVLLKAVLTGSCFYPQESEEGAIQHHDDDANGLFAVLQVSVERGHVKTLRCLVSQRVGGVSVDARGRHGQTALHVAAARGRRNVIDVLCELGADVGATDLLGWAALHQAAYYGQTAAVQHLVERYGAGPHIRSSAGLTPLTLAEEQLQRCEDRARTSWDTPEAADEDQRKAGLQATVAYLRSIKTDNRIEEEKRKSVEFAVEDVKTPTKMAGLMQRIVALGQATETPSSYPSACSSPAVELAGGAKKVSYDVNRAIDHAWGAESDSQGGEDRGGGGATVLSVNSGEVATVRERERVEGSKGASSAGGSASAASSPDRARAEMSNGEAVVCGVGITLNIDVDGEYVIKRIAENGPADVKSESGESLILAGDLLETIDGRTVRDASYADLAGWILGTAGSVVEISLRRKGVVSILNLIRAPLGNKVLSTK